MRQILSYVQCQALIYISLQMSISISMLQIHFPDLQ